MAAAATRIGLAVAFLGGPACTRSGSRPASAAEPVPAATSPYSASPGGAPLPVGIPPPAFGMTEVAPRTPEPWTVATAGFYYVDAESSNADDARNPLGTPERPRATIPNQLPAGAVVLLRGRYDNRHGGPRGLQLSGPASQPVFIRGPSERPRITAGWEIAGSYFVLENLEFAFAGPGDSLVLAGPTDHGALRRSEVRGNPDAGGVAIAGSLLGGEIKDVLIWDNRIHDNGDVTATYDQDVHGIAVGPRVSRLWVLDNEIDRNSGDGVQINAGRWAQETTHHIYVGRNVFHHNRQTGFWTKQAADVIFSENLAYAHRPSSSSSGACAGFQYAPERVWFVNNQIRDCEFGISGVSDNGLGSGRDVYLVGNVIHDIHASSPFNPNTAWSQTGILLVGGTRRFVVNNTLYDVEAGINSPASSGSLELVNNVVSHVGRGQHVFVEMTSLARTSMLRHNLLDGAARIRWGGSRAYDVPGFAAAFPGRSQGDLGGDPGFVDGDADDWRLRPASRGVDAGVEHEVYTTFRDLYGLDIARDRNGNPRPSGPAWDIGAHERR